MSNQYSISKRIVKPELNNATDESVDARSSKISATQQQYRVLQHILIMKLTKRWIKLEREEKHLHWEERVEKLTKIYNARIK